MRFWALLPLALLLRGRRGAVSREKALPAPAAAFAGESDAIVQSESAIRPELDLDRRQPEAAPVVGGI